MKPIFFVLLITALVFSSCSNDDNAKIVGKWKLVQTLADPGDGSGVFQDVESSKILMFSRDNTFSSNEKLCISNDASSNGTFDVNHLYINNCNEKAISKLKYELEGGALIVYFPCIEPCGEKYIKVK